MLYNSKKEVIKVLKNTYEFFDSIVPYIFVGILILIWLYFLFDSNIRLSQYQEPVPFDYIDNVKNLVNIKYLDNGN